MAKTFKNLFDSTQEGLRAAPQGALATFEAKSRQAEGLRSDISIRGFRLTVDEPAELGGSDAAPNPVEYVLAALGSCQEITYRLYADALGIPLDSVSVTVRGDIDLRGFFAADEGVRPGFRNIHAEVLLESPAPEAELERLKATVDAHCPVLDVLRNVTPVKAQLRTTGRENLAGAA